MSIWSSLMSALAVYNSMGSLGALGDISFHVSSWNDIHTIEDLQRNAKNRTVTHAIIGKKPFTEYLGPDLQTISFKIKLNAQWGVNPVLEVEKLVGYCEEGTVLTFTLGGKKFGKNKWMITSVGEAVKYYDNRGAILSSEVDISLQEYVEPKLSQTIEREGDWA